MDDPEVLDTPLSAGNCIVGRFEASSRREGRIWTQPAGFANERPFTFGVGKRHIEDCPSPLQTRHLQPGEKRLRGR
jgi:hypothetical protein